MVTLGVLASLLSVWSVVLCVASYRVHTRATATGVVAVMAATDMQNAMASRAGTEELYDIIRRYVNMPAIKSRPS